MDNFDSGRERAIAEQKYFNLCQRVREYSEAMDEAPTEFTGAMESRLSQIGVARLPRKLSAGEILSMPSIFWLLASVFFT